MAKKKKDVIIESGGKRWYKGDNPKWVEVVESLDDKPDEFGRRTLAEDVEKIFGKE